MSLDEAGQQQGAPELFDGRGAGAERSRRGEACDATHLAEDVDVPAVGQLGVGEEQCAGHWTSPTRRAASTW